jgi:hypothetical protein
MLLPALASAREKARRASCATNLSQMGRALESYLSDYGMYLPSWPGWGIRPVGSATDPSTGVFADPRLGQAVKTGTMPFYANPVIMWRTVASASKWSGSYAAADWQRGALNLAPTGLGYLLTSNYISTAELFYCPSVGNFPEANWNFGGGHNRQALNLRDWRAAGGVGSDTLLYGNWSNISRFNVWYEPPNPNFKAILGDYHSRLNPVFDNNLGLVAWNYITYTGKGGASNRQVFWQGCPMFKTSRLLENRVILTDSWDRQAHWCYPYNNFPPAPAGFGFYGHKDGYNALYGDYHTAWYGDPQNRLVWWPIDHNDSNNNMNMTGMGGYAYSYHLLIWHLFDVNAGVDVNGQ